MEIIKHTDGSFTVNEETSEPEQFNWREHHSFKEWWEWDRLHYGENPPDLNQFIKWVNNHVDSNHSEYWLMLHDEFLSCKEYELLIKWMKRAYEAGVNSQFMKY